MRGSLTPKGKRDVFHFEARASHFWRVVRQCRRSHARADARCGTALMVVEPLPAVQGARRLRPPHQSVLRRAAIFGDELRRAGLELPLRTADRLLRDGPYRHRAMEPHAHHRQFAAAGELSDHAAACRRARPRPCDRGARQPAAALCQGIGDPGANCCLAADWSTSSPNALSRA